MSKPLVEIFKKIVWITLVSFIAAAAIESVAVAAPLNQSANTLPSIAQSKLPWMDKSHSPEVRAKLLIDAMTLDQKIQQLAGP